MKYQKKSNINLKTLQKLFNQKNNKYKKKSSVLSETKIKTKIISHLHQKSIIFKNKYNKKLINKSNKIWNQQNQKLNQIIGSKSQISSKIKSINLKNNLPHHKYKKNSIKFSKKTPILKTQRTINEHQYKIQTKIKNQSNTKFKKVMKTLI